MNLSDVAFAKQMLRNLEGAATFFKVGLALKLAEGVEGFIRSLIADG